LARAIASSQIPVISAIGHETDFTIIDFVADLRAPTPSAAAELVIRSRQDIEEHSAELHLRLARAMRYRLLMGRQALTELAQHGAFARMMDVINQRQQKLDDLTYRLEKSERRLLEQYRRRWESVAGAVRHYDVRRVLAGVRKELDSHLAAMIAATRNQLLQQRAYLDRITRQIEALSPLAILDRGYALVFDSSGKLLKDSTAVPPGDEISARLSRGSLTAIVKTTNST
jgi:exodeoxyribonuclease VII large subunit